MNFSKIVGLLAMSVASAAALSQTDTTVAEREALERARIRQTRTSEHSRFAGLEAQCYKRFAVSDCLAEVHRERRDVLSDLRRQELSLNDAQRKRRAAEQILRSDEKALRVP